MKTKIYTKTGDQGTTRLVDGSCVEKFNPRVEAYGCVDELNSYLGVVRYELTKNDQLKSLDGFFEKIQNQLFNLGSLLACQDAAILSKLPAIHDTHVIALEQQIDLLTLDLPELRHFILPAGHSSSGHLHVARTICRRAERRTAEVFADSPPIGSCLQYLNRLSDFLFVAARWANLKTGHNDVTWKKTE